MSRLRRVVFACNDIHGDFAGRAEAVDFAGALDIEARGRAVALTVEDGRLRIHRRWFAYQRSTAWYGNTSWTAFWLKPIEAKRLMRCLRASGKWTVDGGREKLCAWFERDSFGERT